MPSRRPLGRAHVVQGRNLLVAGRHKIPVIQDDDQVPLLHQLVIVHEHALDPPSHLGRRIDDVTIDEGVIGALEASARARRAKAWGSRQKAI